MFRSKKEVDRHVKDIFTKLKSSDEKKLRYYNIAKLYYQVGDYESAKKYVSTYLETRDKSAGAHKLLGQTLEALGQKEAAFTQYKISLELEPKQDELILKVCELLAEAAINVDIDVYQYWVDRADRKFQHHPIVFQLKEKMLTVAKPNGNDEDLEKLITSELSVRQTDVHLQVKLLKHYAENNRLEDAYNHAVGIEATHSHRNSIIWYRSLSELLVKCEDSKSSDWTFWVFYISVLERYAALCLKEQGNIVKESISDATQAVFNFDQSLSNFEAEHFPNHPAFTEHMMLHMWGQLHFHLACLVLRKTKEEKDSWSEAGRLCAPLLLTALHVTPIDPTVVWTMHLLDRLKNQVQVWYREGSYRCSQAGHVLQDYARDNPKKLLDRIDRYCTSSWRQRVYQRIFVGRLYQDGKTTHSYFANSSMSNPPLRLCSYNELKRFDEISEDVWPDSLHHQIWLGLKTRPHNSQNKNNGPHPNQTSRVFCELQFSVYNLSQAAPDSLSRLDVDAFLNAAILCASTVSNPEEFPTLPADLTDTLCTCAQEKWWSYAYKVYTMDKQTSLDDDLGEIRLELQRGLEVIRCLGNHGLHPVILVHLARIFHYRAEALKKVNPEHSHIPDLEARSEMYWSTAIPLLERLLNNQVLRLTNSKYFNCQGKEMNNAEVIKALEEGKLLLAQRLVREKLYEKAIEALQALKCPEASFLQGQMYEKLADEIVSSIPRESLTSEMRSQHIIILSKARECFYLTLDRLRSPGTNPKHPLNSELFAHITEIENKLKRIDPDLSRGDLSRNECDGMSDESYSSAHSIVDQQVTNIALPGLSTSINILSTPQKNVHRAPKQSSTPYRPQHQDILDLSRNRSEARPSPERLDAQIRSINQMIQSKDNMIQSITEQNKTILELNKTVVDKLEELTKEVAELRKEIQKQRIQPTDVNPNLEEDLCVLNEDDYNDLNYNANQSGPTSSISGNIFPPSHRHPYSQLVYPSATAFQGYYPTGMPFSDPNTQAIPPLYPPSVYSMPVLYPRTRSKIPENVFQQGIFTARVPTQISDLMQPTNQPLQMPLPKVETTKTETIIKDAPVNKVPPVNVVITTSDILPTTTQVVQPTLSVTIPPHFRQGNISAPIVTEQSAPHCYQISMPSQATIPTTVNLPPLSNTLTTTPASISVSEQPKQDNSTICSTGSPNSSDHEHDPIPDFVPVIPLPAEVKVTTGEEDEETLFIARAKLYRFVDNEWKERGTGNVKLLKNKEGKVRLLMRREQVLKVCANHFLAPNMELTTKSNNEKTWCWVAHDFADGELKLEKFCIRFKTVEEGISFKEHFDKAKASLTQSSKKANEITDNASTKVNTVSNNIKKSEKPKVETKPSEQVVFTSGQSIQKQPVEAITTSRPCFSFGDVKTSKDTTVVGGLSFTSTPIIQKVATTEPAKTTSASDVKPFSKFTFNKTVTTASSFMTTTQKSTVGEATTTTQSFSFCFTTSPAGTTTVPTNVNTHSTPISSSQPFGISISTENPSSNMPQFSLRRPHAPPSSAITSATSTVGIQDDDAAQGEQDVLFSEKISLRYYHSDTKQWEDKGTGQLRILWSPKTNKVRLSVKEETSSKVLYNYNVLSKMPFTFEDGGNTAVIWNFYYGPDNKTAMFMATFKTADQASSFYRAITNYQQKMVNDCISAENVKKQETTKQAQASKTQQPSLSEMFKPAAGSWECEACYTRNSATDMKCLACEAPRPSASDKAGISTTSSFPQVSKPVDSSWKCKCSNVNAADKNYCVICDAPKDPSLPPKPKTAGFILSTNTSAPVTPFTFGIPQDANKKTTGKFSFQLSTPNNVSKDSKSTEADAQSDISGSRFIFGMPQKSNTQSNKSSTFTFGSPGKSFEFNFAPKSPTKSAEGDENSEEEVVESDDIHFTPVIPLPEKIEVKTGEENEEVLYSHRAKLFRYDKSVNEWKERGLGDIKLLRHKETGKLRLVMRREQILKLCLNHFVLSDLEMKPKDEKTWMWNAADYSEGEIEHMLFACRFKTPDIAKNFKNVVDNSRKENKVPTTKKDTETEVGTSAKGSPVQEIEVLYEVKVTPEEKKEALRLQLPENFYAYKQKPDCPGCRGCEEAAEETSLAPKASIENQKPQISMSAIQFPSKPTSTISEVTAGTNVSSVFKPGTGFRLFGTDSLPTTSSSTLTFGNTDSGASSDKNTNFSVVMPQPQFSIPDVQKSVTDIQSILSTDDLKICSPMTSQAQTTSASSLFQTSVTPTPLPFIFNANSNKDSPFNLNTGKNMFGGTSKKDASGLLKPSSLNVSVTTSESVFSKTFNSQSKTSTTTASVFGGAATPTFGSSAVKISSESTEPVSSSFTSPVGTANTTVMSINPANPVVTNAATPFSFNLFFGAQTSASSFTTSTPTTTNVLETTSASETQKELEVAFFPTSGESFSTLAAKNPQPAFKKETNFSFAGAGTAVFGSKSNPPSANKSIQKTKDHTTEKKDENEEEEYDHNENDQEHDPHFEPIVPLPDVVEVRTGEEEEEKVFCERAKLYRYNNATREWKERGVGEMKILHHATYGTYRLLLRREQVYKVVCNFLLTPDISFNKLSRSDRAWMWAGMNHAEEQPCIEQLAVKFKNSELATKFKDTVDKIQQTLTEIREKSTEDNPIVEEPDDENEDVDEVEHEGEDEDEEDDEGEEEEEGEDDEEEEEEDDEDRGDEEDEDEEDDQYFIIFKKRATLLAKTSKASEWSPVALGTLIIYHDAYICGEKITLKADETAEIVSSTIISMNTQMQVSGKECVWTAIDYALNPAERRTLKALFSSTQAAQQMQKCFENGIQVARESNITEEYYDEVYYDEE
nr:PREDICTED: E3 SUMO-protein ligase RanBP2-like isoform X1 [Megachile rotundata]